MSVFQVVGRGVGECCGTVKLSSTLSAWCTAGPQNWLTAWGEMTDNVTGLVTECWFNTMLGGEWLYPLRDVLFLLYPRVSDPPASHSRDITSRPALTSTPLPV